MTIKKIIPIFMIMIFAFSLQLTSAYLQMDDIYFDPAIISAGDNVDIVIQYSADSFFNDMRNSNKDYTFGVKLVGDDSLTEQYVTIVDSDGDSLIGRVFVGQYYNRVFRIKVADNAPIGEYQFKLEGQWYRNGVPITAIESKKFFMFVKKAGIALDVAGVTSEPWSVRAGDDFVKLKVYLENTGERDAKSVQVNLNLPEGFEASYSDNNRVFAGQVTGGENKLITFNVDVDDSVKKGVYNFTYIFDFKDSDNNIYNSFKIIPFYIKSSPSIKVVSYVGEGFVGSSKLYVTIKNVGDESAESVDVRILKQSSQPFDFDVRSDYIGELIPGEEGVAIFDIDVIRGAEKKEYDLKLLIRAKGDSDEGDDNIYVFNDRAKFMVVGSLFNMFFIIGVIGVIIITAYFVWIKKFKNKSSEKKR